MDDRLNKLIDAVKRDGVVRGREEAERIIEQAKSDAAGIVAEARAEAESLVEEAHRKAAAVMKNLDQQMALALRDLVLRAREELEDLVALGPIRRRTEEAVSDPEFVKKLIFMIISEYTKRRASRQREDLHIFIPEAMKGDFMKEWIAVMRSDLDVHAALHAEKGMEGFRLVQEGAGGQLIVDADSMMELLRPFLSERFRRILDEQAESAEG